MGTGPQGNSAYPGNHETRDHDLEATASPRRGFDLDELLEDLPPDEARRLRDVWELAGSAPPVPTSDVEPALRRFRSALARRQDMNSKMETCSAPNRPAANRSPKKQAGRRPTLVGLSSALFLLLVIGGLLWWWQSQPVTHYIAPGDQRTVTLPDGSIVELNSGSTLRYERSFEQARRVHLAGEAFFRVAGDERPFVVQTFNATVQATGTQFNVQAWPDRKTRGTTVALEEGHVQFAPLNTIGESIILEPGEVKRLLAPADSAAYVKVVTTSVTNATAWRHGDLVFKNEPFGLILGEVERRFNITLQVEAEALAQRRLSVALRHPTGAEAVVRDLAYALGVKYRPTAQGFTFYTPAE